VLPVPVVPPPVTGTVTVPPLQSFASESDWVSGASVPQFEPAPVGVQVCVVAGSGVVLAHSALASTVPSLLWQVTVWVWEPVVEVHVPVRVWVTTPHPVEGDQAV
jgi:hypothetical protein